MGSVSGYRRKEVLKDSGVILSGPSGRRGDRSCGPFGENLLKKTAGLRCGLIAFAFLSSSPTGLSATSSFNSLDAIKRDFARFFDLAAC